MCTRLADTAVAFVAIAARYDCEEHPIGNDPDSASGRRPIWAVAENGFVAKPRREGVPDGPASSRVRRKRNR